MSTLDVVTNRWGERTIEDQIKTLFEEDGTVYLVPGYFTYNAYKRIRPELTDFLERSPSNELVVIVSSTADQFSPSIVTDLQNLDRGAQIDLYAYPDGCLHAKLYVRTGPNPLVLLGSANLTRVAFEQNLELSVAFEKESLPEGAFEEFVELAERLRSECRPIRRRDTFWPYMAANTASIWVNKARLLPKDAILHQPIVLVLLLVGFIYLVFGGAIW